ncbi:MAG TPA: hypothetical protein VFX89_00580 [Gammaproteobacteria bacterium]|nr:hypothetical protein [Gammaproteobacteria bacterium]
MRVEFSAAPRLALGLIALVAAAALAPAAHSQTDRSRSDSGTPASRDFGGTWDRAAPARPAGGAPAAARETGVSPALGGSGVPGAQPSNGAPPPAVPTPPLKPQYLGEYQARQKEIRDATARGEPLSTPDVHCLPQGMPAMMLAIFPMEVLQTSGQLTIIEEAFNQVRRIYIGGQPVPVEDAEPGFYGHSWAKWEGDTLVVETVGIKDVVRYQNVPHSANMRIHERMKKTDADHFEDEVTVVDPEYLTEPWKFTFRYQRRPDYKMYEYVCEDNREYTDAVSGQQKLRVKPR